MQDLAGELRRIMANFDGDQFTDEDIAATIDWYNTTKTLDPDRFRISHKQSETHLQEHHRSHLRMLTRCYPEVDFSRVL